MVPKAFFQSAADESKSTWELFLKHTQIVYRHLDNSSNVLKLDGAKGAWAVIKEKKVCQRTAFRDHRHRSANAASLFGKLGKKNYQRIAKARNERYRDKLIGEMTPKFKT